MTIGRGPGAVKAPLEAPWEALWEALPEGPGLTPEAKAEAQKKADAFLEKYLADLGRLEKEENTSYWKAANSGEKADFDASAKAKLEQKKLHSDSKRYAELTALLAQREALAPLTRRSLELAELAFKGNQLPEDLLKKMVDAATEIERIFSTHRGTVGGKAHTNNELLELLRKERNHARRQAAWEATKQVGAEVGPKLVALAKVRNEAAKKLGFADYWDMSVRLQEHDPKELLAVFAELMTQKVFRPGMRLKWPDFVKQATGEALTAAHFAAEVK